MIYIIPFCILIIVTVIIIGIKARGKRIEEDNKRNAAIQLEKANRLSCIQAKQEDFYSLLDYLQNSLLAHNHFFAHSEKEKFILDNEVLIHDLDFIEKEGAYSELKDERKIQELHKILKDLEETRQKHNAAFIEKELRENQEFFETALSYPLDKQQRQSIVNLEDNLLVISSAGSGKTSTMMGKLLYLVEKRGIKPNRILTITYTHKAAQELTQRLLGSGLECITFHKLAMNIIKHVENETPTIASADTFMKTFYSMLKEDSFRNSVLNYLTDYKSILKTEHEYQTSQEYYLDRKKYGVIALFPDMDGKMIATKSEQEKHICNYLTEFGIQFRYEEPYEFNTQTLEYRQYKPDFSIYYKDSDGKMKRIYLEHYAIDKNKHVPKWFAGHENNYDWQRADQTYWEGIHWKEKLHRRNNTTLIYTTSADFYDGTAKEKLKNSLQKAGVPIHEVSTEELLKRIFNRSKNLEHALMQMTESFINLVKASGKEISDVYMTALERNERRDMYVIEKLMMPLWDAYHKALKEKHEMDFTDVISKATKYCQEGLWDRHYDFILIDEFQDISADRYRLLQALRTKIPMTKLYCVGDDWQSIYRFSGSDMSLFTEFSKYFGYTEECKLETTYRFEDPLIMESRKFIERNPLQKKKAIHPRTENPPTTKLSFLAYANQEHLQSLVEQMIQRVPEGKSIYIISRYSYDIRSLASANRRMDYDPNNDQVTLYYGDRKVRFITIHGSKGLEADYVFILNCNSGLYGFPSLVSDDPVLDYVLSDKEHYEYAEERRVFYVGITRAKEHTVVLYDENRPSPFVTEMHKAKESGLTPCPVCGIGHRIIKYENFAKNKQFYRVWGCDNREANCQYYEREFSNGDFLESTGKFYRKIHKD